MSASMLCLHAIRLMKSVLACTETKKLQDVLEAAFGSNEDNDEDIPTEEEKEEPLTSSGVKRKIPQPQGSSKQKVSHPSKAGICTLTDATIYFPTTLDASTSYLHAGVNSAFYSSHKSSQAMKTAGYKCNYSITKKTEGGVNSGLYLLLNNEGPVVKTYLASIILGLLSTFHMSNQVLVVCICLDGAHDEGSLRARSRCLFC